LMSLATLLSLSVWFSKRLSNEAFQASTNAACSRVLFNSGHSLSKFFAPILLSLSRLKPVICAALRWNREPVGSWKYE